MHDMYTQRVIGFDKLELLVTGCSDIKYFANRKGVFSTDTNRG